MVLKESLGLLDSRGTQELRVCQGLKEPLVLQERRVRPGSQACRECQELMDRRVTQEKRDHLVKREILDPLVLKAQLVILDPEA